MKRYKKGQYGYRRYHRRVEICKVAIGGALILAQLLCRGLTDSEAARNILTVMAILSVLPVANVASPLLAAWRYKTPTEEFYKKVLAYEEKGPVLYDLVITSREALMPIDALLVHPTGVFAYCTAKKLDQAKAEKFFKEMFTGHRLDIRVKLIFDERTFLNRLAGLKPRTEYEDDGSVDYAVTLLKSISM